MKFLALVVFIALTHKINPSETVTKTLRWTKLSDLFAAGWKQGTVTENRIQAYPSPVAMDPRLLNLNLNFTDEVWGNGFDRSSLVLQTASFPMYCGITNATLNVKLYTINGIAGTNYIYPVVGYEPSYEQHFEASQGTVRWQWISSEINVTEANFNQEFRIVYNMGTGNSRGLMVFDEISLTFTVQQDEESCPYYCNHDCEYRALGCHSFYTCVDRTYKAIYNCSAENGLAFNPVTKGCDFMENVEGCRRETNPGECICAYKPHQTNNSLYYYCANTCQPEECETRHCPDGLVWKIDTDGIQKCHL